MIAAFLRTRVLLAVASAGILVGAALYPAVRPDKPAFVAVSDTALAGTPAARSRVMQISREPAERVPNPVPLVQAAAFAAVQKQGGVPAAAGKACPAASLAISYAAPGPGWSSGGFISPLGPLPGRATTAVNGLVVCRGSRYGFVGFEAVLADGAWVVELVPDPTGGVDEHHDEQKANDKDEAAKPKPVVKGAPLAGLVDGPTIEGYPRYEGQSTCSPGAKKGTLALRNLLLARYPSTQSFGISRGCGVGGRSEHKEGRAFDWGANINQQADRAAVASFLASLFATDKHGHRHALARRMGVMYVIWDRQMWSAYRADAGWRPYSGSSPHTDHAHISLSWAGARGQTSFWSGVVVPGLPDEPLRSSGSGSGGRSGVRKVRYDGRGDDAGDRERAERWEAARRLRRERAEAWRRQYEAELQRRREQRAEAWRKAREEELRRRAERRKAYEEELARLRERRRRQLPDDSTSGTGDTDGTTGDGWRRRRR